MTIMWIIIMLLAISASIAGLIYLIFQASNFSFINSLSKGRRKLNILYSALLLLAFIVAIWGMLGYTNMCVILISLTIIWLLTDFIFYIASKFNLKFANNRKRRVGLCAIILTSIYLGIGLFNAQHVSITNYSINTAKSVEPLKILQFSDSHIGTTFNGKGFKKHVEKMNSLNPDIIVITGDFIDGSSNYEDTMTAIEALSALNPKYGVYFCFGNHDKNYYGEETRRNFTTKDLIAKFEENHVQVLEDDIVELDNGYVIIGRQDKSEENRASISELMSEIDINKYVIDLNHQPNDYDNEEAAGVDLVLSGHTHGGQLFPIREVGVIIGANDKTYGLEKRSDTNFIVSSGISDWAMNFKTGCKSEIVVINIEPLNM